MGITRRGSVNNQGQTKRNPRKGEFTTLTGKTKTGILRNELGKLSESFETNGRYFTLTFSAALVTGNVINGNVNGNPITAVTFATSSDATLDAIATEIAKNTAVRRVEVVEVAGGTSNDRTIRVWPDTNEEYLALDSWVVTAGASQATVSNAVVDNTLFDTTPAKMEDDGTISPYSSADGPFDTHCIGFTSFQDNDHFTRPTVSLRGYMVLACEVTEATNCGPVRFTGLNRSTGYNQVNGSGVDLTNHVGWALTVGSSQGDIIRVLVKA